MVFVRFRRFDGSRSDGRQHGLRNGGSESGRLEDRLPNQRRQSSKIATTTGADGKGRGKIIYKLDDAGRYQSGQVFAANGDLRSKTLYAYGTTGRLTQETQLAKDDPVRNRIVYSYDTDGHQTGYAIYDGAGLLIGRTTAQNDAPGRSPLRPPP
ncbi:MAG: hypothetical protein WCE51_05985 [Chthoniobacterales bacterium]